MPKSNSYDKSAKLVEDAKKSGWISTKATAFVGCCTAGGTWLGQFFTRWFVAPNVAGVVFDGVRDQTYSVMKNVTLGAIKETYLGYVPGKEFLVSGIATELSFQAADIAYDESIKLMTNQGMIVGSIVGTVVGIGSTMAVGCLYNQYKKLSKNKEHETGVDNSPDHNEDPDIDALTNNLAKLSLS
ncbi:MAG: hypothetical protein U1E78_03980 [Gammaproteobacteria bacterium]